MRSDYHTHTPLCHHATGSAPDYVAAALAAGLTEYGVSDHAPQTPEPFDDWRMAMADLPAYQEWIAEARACAGSQLTVRAGLECDWLPDCQSHIETLRASYDWDYLIGSVHYLARPSAPRWDFDNPAHLSQWENFSEQDLQDLWLSYWKTYTEMVQSGLFEIHAHPDLIKKFAFAPSGDLRPFYEPVIAALETSGSAFEINTAGWHKPCNEQYPARGFLELAAQARIPVYINSDAHAPEEVARDFDQAHQLAAELNLNLQTRLPR